MFCTRSLFLSCFFVFSASFAICSAADQKFETFNDPAKAGVSFVRQGEYVGTLNTQDGEETYAAQIIARGGGNYHLVGFRGGLPGEGWDKSEKIEADGSTLKGEVAFAIPNSPVKAILKDGKLTVVDDSGKELGALKKVRRESPTMGAKPPKDAVVLFDGTSADNFENGKLIEGGLLAEGAHSKQKFGDHSLHLEFRSPFMPAAEGQARGNSGCYVQGRYEVQILDSFGLEGKDNECGGIYQASAPAVNMCLPPLSWQTYDIDFTAPQYEDGKKVANARITVKHNGVLIHENLELPEHTPGGLGVEGPEPGPLFLQDHSNPVRFRNIWVVPKK